MDKYTYGKLSFETIWASTCDNLFQCINGIRKPNRSWKDANLRFKMLNKGIQHLNGQFKAEMLDFLAMIQCTKIYISLIMGIFSYLFSSSSFHVYNLGSKNLICVKEMTNMRYAIASECCLDVPGNSINYLPAGTELHFLLTIAQCGKLFLELWVKGQFV